MATTTNVSLAVYSGLAGGLGGTAFTYLAVGTGTTAESAGHEGLITEVGAGSGLARASATVTQQTTGVTNNTLQLVKAWSVTGTVSISEVGAFNASSNGIMAWRDKLSAVKNVVDGDTYTLTGKTVFS